MGSGSAALGVGAEIISTYGPDSDLGRTAAVMLGSTETTFYTIAVYFGAVGITKTRYAVPAALCADLTGFLASGVALGSVVMDWSLTDSAVQLACLFCTTLAGAPVFDGGQWP